MNPEALAFETFRAGTILVALGFVVVLWVMLHRERVRNEALKSVIRQLAGPATNQRAADGASPGRSEPVRADGSQLPPQPMCRRCGERVLARGGLWRVTNDETCTAPCTHCALPTNLRIAPAAGPFVAAGPVDRLRARNELRKVTQ